MNSAHYSKWSNNVVILYDQIIMSSYYRIIISSYYHLVMTSYDDVIKVIFGFKSASKTQIESYTPPPRIVERKSSKYRQQLLMRNMPMTLKKSLLLQNERFVKSGFLSLN